MKKILSLILITTFTLVVNVNASSDGELLLEKNKPSEVKDCFETVNRASFALNQVLDGIIFKPVASVYRKLPSPVKSGVSNSLDNLSNLVTIPNNLLQGDFALAGVKEDYGQSLAKAGVGPGCYVVLPILGPSTARDTVASVANFFGGDAWYNVTVRNDTQYFRDIDYYSSKITGGVDFRAKNFDAIENLEKNSLDFYASVKSLYLQDRQQKILNVKKIIETQNDSDWEEIEDQQ